MTKVALLTVNPVESQDLRTGKITYKKTSRDLPGSNQSKTFAAFISMKWTTCVAPNWRETNVDDFGGLEFSLQNGSVISHRAYLNALLDWVKVNRDIKRVIFFPAAVAQVSSLVIARKQELNDQEAMQQAENDLFALDEIWINQVVPMFQSELPKDVVVVGVSLKELFEQLWFVEEYTKFQERKKAQTEDAATLNRLVSAATHQFIRRQKDNELLTSQAAIGDYISRESVVLSGINQGKQIQLKDIEEPVKIDLCFYCGPFAEVMHLVTYFSKCQPTQWLHGQLSSFVYQKLTTKAHMFSADNEQQHLIQLKPEYGVAYLTMEVMAHTKSARQEVVDRYNSVRLALYTAQEFQSASAGSSPLSSTSTSPQDSPATSPEGSPVERSSYLNNTTTLEGDMEDSNTSDISSSDDEAQETGDDGRMNGCKHEQGEERDRDTQLPADTAMAKSSTTSAHFPSEKISVGIAQTIFSSTRSFPTQVQLRQALQQELESDAFVMLQRENPPMYQAIMFTASRALKDFGLLESLLASIKSQLEEPINLKPDPSTLFPMQQ